MRLNQSLNRCVGLIFNLFMFFVKLSWEADRAADQDVNIRFQHWTIWYCSCLWSCWTLFFQFFVDSLICYCQDDSWHDNAFIICWISKFTIRECAAADGTAASWTDSVINVSRANLSCESSSRQFQASLSLSLSVDLSLYLSTYPSMYLSIYRSICR